MRKRTLGGFILFLPLFSFAAEARWSRMASTNFEMYTTAGERSARDTLRYFEQVRGMFAQTMPRTLAQVGKVRIVAFSSMKEFEPYRINDFAIAYYQSSGDHDYIVMSHTGAETFPIAVHEYVHLVTQHANLKAPPWLSEGLAELYSTIKPMGDKILVGSLIAGRYQALLQEKWVPLDIILHADQNSPYYNEKNKAGSLYNEGWALTHMLVLSPDYRPKFSDLLGRITAGMDSAAALEQTYRVPIAQIDTELRGYLRGGQFRGFLMEAKLEKISEDLRAEPADEFERRLLLAEVGDRPSRQEATRGELQELIKEYPNRPEPHVDLGYLNWKQRDRDETIREFDKAFELGSRNARLLWDFGRMEEGADRKKAIAAFNELLKQQPDRVEVRLQLAAMQLGERDAKAATVTLAAVKKVSREEAPRLFLLLAHASLETGDRGEARTAAQRLNETALNDDDRKRAAEILRYLDRTTAQPQGVQTGRAASSDAPPVLRHNEASPFDVTEVVRENKRAAFSGKFVELQCSSPAKIVLDTLEGKKILLIDDPTRLMVNGHNGETMELSCGPQKAASVRIEFDPPGDKPGIDGVVRAIHFDEK